MPPVSERLARAINGRPDARTAQPRPHARRPRAGSDADRPRHGKKCRPMFQFMRCLEERYLPSPRTRSSWERFLLSVPLIHKFWDIQLQASSERVLETHRGRF
jgi:hypothetical protein